MNTITPTDTRHDENVISTENLELEEKKEEEETEDENSLGEDISNIVQGRYHIAKTMLQTSGQ